MAKLDRRLNIVFEVTRENGAKAYVHSTPISRNVYDEHFLLLTKTINMLYAEEIAPAICTRVCMLMMRKVAKEMDGGDSTTPNQNALERGLLPEIWRLTNVVMQVESGYEVLPFAEASKLLDEDDIKEVQNALCFFTAASWFHKQKEMELTIYPILRSGAQIGSWNVTEFQTSIQTSTQEEPIGQSPTATALSIPH